MKPKVSIVIATYNGEKTIEKCLESVLNQTYPREQIEAIVVDDGSSDGTVKIIKNFPVKLLRQKHRGTAAAHNRGIKKARGKYIFLLSHDCYAALDWVESAVEIFESDPKLGIAQGQVLPSREIKKPVVHCTTLDHLNRSFPTVAIAYRTEALNKAGRFFRKDLSRYGDDAELAYRILERGFAATFLDQPTAYHEVLPEPFFKGIKNAWGCYRFPLIFKLHPWARKFLHCRIFWGSRWRYLRILFWPVVFLGSLWSIRRLHQTLWELVFSASLVFGSLRFRSVVL